MPSTCFPFTRHKLLLSAVISGLVSSLCTLPAHAVSYGIYDARGLAMGGTAVAAGNTSQAHFYNPALLAFHDKDEDESKDGRFIFPHIVAQVSESTESVITAAGDRVDAELSNAIDAFNLDPSQENAASVASTSGEILNLLDDLGREDLALDAFFGLSVTEPSLYEGGAFYFGVRALGAGSSNITAEDRELIGEYVRGMETLAAGGNIGTVNPALFDENGALIDPVDDLTSSGDIGAIAIAEWGLALAKEFTFFDQAIALGITPKMMRIDVYRDDVNVSDVSSDDDGFGFSDSHKTHLTFNADFGIAAVIAENYRVSFAVKDAFAKEYDTVAEIDPITNEPLPAFAVDLKPRTRMGLAYVNEKLTVGLDYDLEESTPIAGEASVQDLSLGAEYLAFGKLALRAGYRTDQTSQHDDVISAGFGYQWTRAILEFSYAKSDLMRGASLQLGWAF